MKKLRLLFWLIGLTGCSQLLGQPTRPVVESLAPNHHLFYTYQMPVIFGAPIVACGPLDHTYTIKIPVNHFEACRSICMMIKGPDSLARFFPIDNCSSPGFLVSNALQLRSGVLYRVSFSNNGPSMHHPHPYYRLPNLPDPLPPPPLFEIPDTSFVVRIPFCAVKFNDRTLVSLVAVSALDTAIVMEEVEIDLHQDPRKQSSTGDPKEGVLEVSSTVFPNPAKDFLKIIYSTANAEISALQITDILGRSMPVMITSKDIGEAQLDISSLPHGTYYLRFNIEGTVVFKQFLKE